MNELSTPKGAKPVAENRAPEEKYETGKGCLTLLLVVIIFFIVSAAVSFLIDI